MTSIVPNALLRSPSPQSDQPPEYRFSLNISILDVGLLPIFDPIPVRIYGLFFH